MAEKRGKLGRPKSRADGAAEAIAIVKEFMKSHGLSGVRLGKLAGVGQSSVSRALNQSDPIFTPSLKDLLHYVTSHRGETGLPDDADGVEPEPAASRLQKAALDAWDGTEAGLEKLVRILGDLKNFRVRGRDKAAAGTRR